MAHTMPQLEGVDHRWVNVGETSFHVAEAGEGHPVVLLHGWPQHWYMWRLVIPPLAERHRVLAIDLRGFGWSDIAWTGFEKEGMADDIAGVLAELGVERAGVVGHDWGAWIGYLLGMRRPDLVSSLVALSVPPPWMRRRTAIPSLWRFYYQVLLASPWLGRKLVETRSWVGRTIRHWTHDDRNLGPEMVKLYTRDLKASTRARASSLLYRSFLLRDVPAVWRGHYRGQRLEVPTLVIHGAHDPVVPPRLYRDSHLQADRLAVECVPDAGHFLPEERPELITERVLAHVAASTSAPAAA